LAVRKEVANHLPSPGLMNHVVATRSSLPDRTYWFDCYIDRAKGGGLANFTQASYLAMRLVISPGVVATRADESRWNCPGHWVRSHAIFDLRAGLFAESALKVTTNIFQC